MSRIAPIDLQSTCPEARDIVLTLGHPPPESSAFIERLAQSPAALEVFLAAQCALADGMLTRQQRAMIGLAVAEINGSVYGIAMQQAAAAAAGLSRAEIKNARYGRADDVATHALLRFAVAVVLQRGDVSAGDFQAVRRSGFNDACIAEVIATIAVCQFADFFNNVAQTPVDITSPAHAPRLAASDPVPFPPAVPAAAGAGQ
ncbi:MAG: carboxymuconolactone decarboxylase family protein [Opitutaceae bacterium]|nr:carboxymuconolactone decarboxylase family protein [Opitutaceae bacterium]